MELLKESFRLAAISMETVGVLVIVVGCAVESMRFLGRAWHPGARDSGYADLRRGLGKAIILGLEFLIAGDIIRTVAVSHSLESVAVLGVIVLIRSLLSFTLESGIDHRWPWQPRQP